MFRFVTIHAFDRQTAFSSLVRAGIPCSTVKTSDLYDYLAILVSEKMIKLTDKLANSATANSRVEATLELSEAYNLVDRYITVCTVVQNCCKGDSP